jgi:hypothetical protein
MINVLYDASSMKKKDNRIRFKQYLKVLIGEESERRSTESNFLPIVFNE